MQKKVGDDSDCEDAMTGDELHAGDISDHHDFSGLNDSSSSSAVAMNSQTNISRVSTNHCASDGESDVDDIDVVEPDLTGKSRDV